MNMQEKKFLNFRNSFFEFKIKNFDTFLNEQKKPLKQNTSFVSTLTFSKKWIIFQKIFFSPTTSTYKLIMILKISIHHLNISNN